MTGLVRTIEESSKEEELSEEMDIDDDMSKFSKSDDQKKVGECFIINESSEKFKIILTTKTFSEYEENGNK